jgi:predicted nucleotidyltransferase
MVLSATVAVQSSSRGDRKGRAVEGGTAAHGQGGSARGRQVFGCGRTERGIFTAVDDAELRVLGERIAQVDGVVGVLLGGSRARGSHTPNSDYDIGIYYRQPFDIDGLRVLARAVAGEDAALTDLGEWGPWVDGGGWLTIEDVHVDWLYRDTDRVLRAWEDAKAGRFYFHGQVGHPLGVPDFAYVGEVALGIVLADPTGELSKLKAEAGAYPPRLTHAVVGRLSEATFLIGVARKGADLGDAAYLAGCLFRVVGLCAHAIHAHAGRWLINEKGAIDASSALPGAPPEFSRRAHGLFQLNSDPDDLHRSLDLAQRLVDETNTLCEQ